ARSYARTLFYENKDGYLPGRVSDDEKWLALEKPNTTNDSDVFVWNASTKQVTNITKHTGNANNASQQFDRASKYLYFLSDASGEFTAVRRYALADGKVEDVQSAPWDVVATMFSHNGRYRATIVNSD